MEFSMETGKVIEAAIAYFENDIRRISHLLKVYGFAKAIGEKEQLDLQEQWDTCDHPEHSHLHQAMSCIKL